MDFITSPDLALLPGLDRYATGSGYYGDNPWGRTPWIAPTLEELGYTADELVHWDEIEEWDDRIPCRPTIHALETEFDDYCSGGVSLERFEEFLREEGHQPAAGEPAPIQKPAVTRARAKARPARRRRPEVVDVQLPEPEPAGLPEPELFWTDDNGRPIAGAPSHTPKSKGRRPHRRQPKKLPRKAKKRAKKAFAVAPRAIAPAPIREAVEEPAPAESYEQALRRVWGE